MPLAFLLIADDLLMPSRLREGLRPSGASLTVVTSGTTALAALQDQHFDAIFLNLTARRFDPVSLIPSLKSASNAPLVAFAGHIETEKHTAARAAGADHVVANSSIALHLDALLPHLLRHNEDAD